MAYSNYRLMMGSLPFIFQQDYIDPNFLESFFNQGAIDDNQSKMERSMVDKDLPEFSVDAQNSYTVYNFYDDSNYLRELIKKVAGKVQQNVFGDDINAEEEELELDEKTCTSSRDVAMIAKLKKLSQSEETTSMFSVQYSFMSFRSLLFA